MTLNQRPFRILLLGVGTVGGAVLRILQQQSQQIGITTEIVAVMSRNVVQRLQVQAPEYLQRLSPKQLFNSWEELKTEVSDPATAIGTIDAVIELTGGIDNCLPIYRYFLQRQIPIITANKALLAQCGNELFPLAQQNGTVIACEASCGGGIPILQALLYGLRANQINEFHGVLNGTCNFILSQMATKGRNYSEALLEAQASGLAEANPFLDVSGTDTAHKLAILAAMSFGSSLNLEDIPISGIQTLGKTQILAGQKLGLTLKLLASAKLLDNESYSFQPAIALRVGPCFIAQQDKQCHELQITLRASPLASLVGSFNGISFYGNNVGHIYLQGRGAGASATASALLADLYQVYNGTYPLAFADFPNWPKANKQASKNLWPELRQNWLGFVPMQQSGGIIAQLGTILPSAQELFEIEGHQVVYLTQVCARQLEQLACGFSSVSDRANTESSLSYIPILQLPREQLQGQAN